jgi:hypothetical protein
VYAVLVVAVDTEVVVAVTVTAVVVLDTGAVGVMVSTGAVLETGGIVPVAVVRVVVAAGDGVLAAVDRVGASHFAKPPAVRAATISLSTAAEAVQLAGSIKKFSNTQASGSATPL